eukprot:6203718-Pleurochrysis_carterae.AAC.1
MLAALGLVRRRWRSSAKEKSLHAYAMHCFPLLELRRLEVLDLQICQKVGFWPKFLDDERLRIQYIHRLAALGERNCQVRHPRVPSDRWLHCALWESADTFSVLLLQALLHKLLSIFTD